MYVYFNILKHLILTNHIFFGLCMCARSLAGNRSVHAHVQGLLGARNWRTTSTWCALDSCASLHIMHSEPRVLNTHYKLYVYVQREIVSQISIYTFVCVGSVGIGIYRKKLFGVLVGPPPRGVPWIAVACPAQWTKSPRICFDTWFPFLWMTDWDWIMRIGGLDHNTRSKYCNSGQHIVRNWKVLNGRWGVVRAHCLIVYGFNCLSSLWPVL